MIVKKLLTRLAPIIALGFIIIFSSLALVAPPFFSSDQHLQRAAQEGDRFVCTTYFYWYRSGGENFNESIQVFEEWSPEDVASVAAKADQFPPGWPGPTDPNEMVREWNDRLYHDSLSHHPPAAPPVYNASTGEIIEPLQTGLWENLTTWIDWMNPEWHEFEMRTMIRAGIDVLMPVYWYNGLHGQWSVDGLQVLVSTWHSLAQKITDEANFLDGGSRTIEHGRSVLPKIAMFFDTTCMKQLWAHNMSITDPTHDYGGWMENGSGPDLNDPYWKERFWDVIQYFHDDVDNDSVFTWKGNTSIVWLYSGGWFADIGNDVLTYCKERFKETYGRELVFLGESQWMRAGGDGIVPWGASFAPKFPQPQGIPAGAVGPGYYNLGAIRIQPPLYHARDVARYKQEWQEVMDRGAVFIHVETWNELLEGTDIAWSQEYGYQWVDATREMADKFHALSGYVPAPNLDIPVLVVGLSLLGVVTVVTVLVSVRWKGRVL